MESSELERSFNRVTLVDRAVLFSLGSSDDTWRLGCACRFCVSEYYAEWDQRWETAVLFDKER